MSGTFFSLCRFLLFLFRGAVRVDAKNTTISTIRLERWVDFASRFQNLHLLCRAVLRRREEPIHATPNAEQRVVSSWSGALRSVNQRSPARCLGFPFFRWLKMRLEEVVGRPWVWATWASSLPGRRVGPLSGTSVAELRFVS